MHKTIDHPEFKIIEEDKDFKYQKNLTEKLDKTQDEFDQNILNEIVLWKVNRYAHFNSEAIELINSIDPQGVKIDTDQLYKVLFELLQINGVQLAMASTILRFRNPKLFQIIDQRVYRIIYANQQLKLNSYKSEKNIKSQIELYLKYLQDLRNICSRLKIPFEESDRILFMADRRFNKNFRLNNY